VQVSDRAGLIDAARAAGQPPELTAGHDGRPAAEHLSLDAVEFCRTLAGRAPAAGLLTTIVPF
jgi:hypothetical protein